MLPHLQTSTAPDAVFPYTTLFRSFGAHEGDDAHDRVIVAEQPHDFVDSFTERPLLRKQHTISGTQVMNVVLGKTTTLESDDIQAGQPCPVAHHRAVWNDVVFHARHADDHGMATDPRSEERRVGKECVRNGNSGWSIYN